MGVRRTGLRGLRLIFASLKAAHERLSLANTETFLENTICRERLLAISGKAQNNFGVADREPAITDIALYGGRQFEKSQRIGNDCATLANFQRHFLLFELELIDQLGISLGLLYGVKVFALEVFDQGQFQHRSIIGLAQDDGHFG